VEVTVSLPTSYDTEVPVTAFTDDDRSPTVTPGGGTNQLPVLPEARRTSDPETVTSPDRP
jgi:hypothetical protein